MSIKEDAYKYQLRQAEELMKRVAFDELNEWAEKWASLEELRPLVAEMDRHRKMLLGKVKLASDPK
jgi:hypothetical protein